MASEYDTVFPRRRHPPDVVSERPGLPGDDLEAVRRRFAAASGPYLSSPAVWIAWAVILPVAALATPWVIERGGPSLGLLLWSGAVLAGGVVEIAALGRRGVLGSSTPLAGWALRVQGNLSLVAALVSGLLLWHGLGMLLPALWLLLLGHSLFALGGLAFPPLRSAGIIYQLGGIAALTPWVDGLVAFAAATAVGNLWIAAGILRRRRREADCGATDGV